MSGQSHCVTSNKKVTLTYVFFSHGATAPSWPGSPQYRGFTITIRHVTVGWTPLDE